MRSETIFAAIAASLFSTAAAAPIMEKRSGTLETLPAAAAPLASTITPTGTSATENFASGSVFPLPNGFPSPNQAAIAAMQQQGLGTLPSSAPGAPAGSAPAPDDITSLQLIAFNELFEVAYFTELISNITNDVAGYTFPDATTKATTLKNLMAVQAQEEMHALNANGALQKFTNNPIQPCQYTFPVNDFNSAIGLANTFTDVVLGTLQDVATTLATNNDNGLIGPIASVIGQEGEQNGWYRSLQGKTPSSLPFLTASTREIAFTALHSFVVPGSCPNINDINLPVMEPLSLVTPTPLTAADQSLTFSFQPNSSIASQFGPSYNGWSVAYINQQNAPIVEPITNVAVQPDGSVNFSAMFPWASNVMNGLTIAAVVPTTSSSMFTPADVSAAAIYGPALWIVQ